MEGYAVKVKECSKKLTAKERIQIKDTTNSIKLDSATQQGDVLINPDYYAILEIHNEKSDNPDYLNYVIVDKTGQKYVTGSESFWSSFKGIYDEMAEDEGGEAWSVMATRIPSKNRPGKDFITCYVV